MLRAYFAALRKEWVTLMTGALTIPLTVGALFMDTTWQRVVFGLFALACALFASFRVWAVEHQRANALTVAQPTDVAALHAANTRREQEIDALRKQLGRRLSAEQKEIIRRALEPLATRWNTAHPSVSSRLGICVYARPSSDAEDYMEDFADVFRSVSLKVGKFAFESDSEFDRVERYGVWVRWNSQHEKLPIGQTLVDALRRCGVDVTPLDIPYASFVDLIVYRRRPD